MGANHTEEDIKQPSSITRALLVFSSTFIFLFLFVNSVEALDVSSPTNEIYIIPQAIQQNQPYNILLPCTNNGSICTSVTNCTASLTQKGSPVFLNKTLGKTYPPYYNASLTPQQNNISGIFIGDYQCTDGINTGSGQFQLTITPSGESNVLGLFILLFVVCYFVGFFGFFGKNEFISMIGGFALLILGLYTASNGIDVYRNYMTQSLSAITIGLGAIFSITATLSLIGGE